MAAASARRFVKRLAFVAGSSLVIALAFGPLIGRAIGDAHGGAHGAKLVSLGLKFSGAEKCKGSKCHEKGNADAPPTERGNEWNVWAGSDRHSKAFETLKNDESRKIGAAMNIADVTTSKDCLGCHAMDVPANLQGDKFTLAEGNTCTSCHGPDQKWLEAHTEKGWTDSQRGKFPNHADLLKNTGLYDTRPLVARAELCAGCHLAIDAKLVAAGHPQPKFELDYYTEANKDGTPWKHWMTDKGGAEIAKVWLAGQAACARDAMLQLAGRVEGNAGAEAIKAAHEQALSHGMLLAAAVKAVGLGDFSVDGVKAPDAAAAKAAASAAEKLFAAIEKMTPDEASAKKMLAAVAGSSGVATAAGLDGQTQVAYACYALARAVEGNDKAGETVGALFPDPAKPMSADEFNKVLAEVAGKLPK